MELADLLVKVLRPEVILALVDALERDVFDGDGYPLRECLCAAFCAEYPDEAVKQFPFEHEQQGGTYVRPNRQT